MPSWSKIARRIRVPLGFIFAGAYIWWSRPTKSSIAVGSSVALAGVAIRALGSGNVEKNEVLTVTGPYAYTRNPLYLGSIILAFGFLIAARNWWLALIALVILVAIYIPVIRAEEAFLRARFPEFSDYASHVPRLLPRFRAYQNQTNSFKLHLYRQHREYNAALGTALMIAILIAKSVLLNK